MDVSFSAAPITALDGTVIGGAGIVRDITSRKRMEETFRLSEERFRLVVHATKDVIWDWDIGTGGTWRSDSYRERYGDSPRGTESDLEAWKNRIHPDDRDRVWNGIQIAMSRAD